MKILIKNCTLISMDNSREKIEYDMDILINNDRILKIGREISNIGVDRVIDATGKVVLPGVINTHAHVPMSIFRETIDGLKLQEWLHDKIWPMEDKLTKEDIFYASMLSFLEMIKSGCSTINDMYFEADDIIKAKNILGIRLQTTRTLMSVNGADDGEKRIQELKELVEKYDSCDDTLTFNVAIHGLYTSDEEYVKKCIQVSKELNLPIHMHFCENEKEVADIRTAYGRKPSDVLIDNFAGYHTILAHCVKLGNEDLEKIKNLDIHVSTCPISNLKLGCGIPKIAKMMELGINVSLGTDGQGSGSNLDMFEAMKITALLQKGVEEDPTLLNSYDVLKMATINGAKALGMEDIIGSITENKKADIIILNLDDAILKPTNDLVSEIVYNAKGTNVETTIVNGNILMQNRVLTCNVNEKEIIEKCESIINRIRV